jgi:hypothetical protein
MSSLMSLVGRSAFADDHMCAYLAYGVTSNTVLNTTVRLLNSSILPPYI